MRFLHISDLHYLDDYKGKGEQYSNILNRMDDPFTQLDEILEQTGNDFDLVIVSGDVCEFGELSDYRSVRRKLDKRFSCPVYVCSGNHDCRENLIEVFEKKKICGELFEEIMQNDLRLIMLDSSHPEYNDGFISETTCDLLKQALDSNRGTKTVVVTHHHLLTRQFSMPAAQYPQGLKGILDNDDVVTVLTGHTHHIYHDQIMGRPYHTTGSLSFVADMIDGRLCFYQSPSAVVYEYDEGKLNYQEIHSLKDRKILEYW